MHFISVIKQYPSDSKYKRIVKQLKELDDGIDCIRVKGPSTGNMCWIERKNDGMQNLPERKIIEKRACDILRKNLC